MQNIKSHTIVILVPALNIGGVERGVIEIAGYLKKQGYHTVVISSGGKLLPKLLEMHINHVFLPIHSKNPIVFLSNLWRLRRLIHVLNPDLLLPHSRVPTWLVYLLRKLGCRTPFVSHCFGTHRMEPGKLKKAYNSVLMQGDRIIANSHFTKRYFLEYFPEMQSKMVVIPRSVDPDFFDASKISQEAIKQQRQSWQAQDGKFLLLFPTRVSKRKGFEVLIQAVNLLNNQGMNQFYVVILGNYEIKPSYFKYLCTLIQKNNLQNDFYWAGSTNMMDLAYASADAVLAISTEPEAFGRTVIEAQAMGKLVIGTAHGGVLETIEDKVTGLLVRSGDAQNLADTLVFASGLEPSKKLQIVQNAQRNSKNFSLAKACQDSLVVYREFLK